jgi:hypothetical protein
LQVYESRFGGTIRIAEFEQNTMTDKETTICLSVSHLLDFTAARLKPAASKPISPGDVENAVIDQLRAILHTPEIVVRTWRKARQMIADVSEAEVREALEQLALGRALPG